MGVIIRRPHPPTQEWVLIDADTFAEVGREPIAPDEWAVLSADPSAANAAAVAAMEAVKECRDALTDAMYLAALSPYPSAEEQAIIDGQVADSLALFRELPDPPADVIALAASVLTLEVQS